MLFITKKLISLSPGSFSIRPTIIEVLEIPIPHLNAFYHSLYYNRTSSIEPSNNS